MPAPYVSEIKFLGAGGIDFVEVAVDAGIIVTNIQLVVYNPNGSVRTTNSLGTLDNTEAGRDIYLIDAATSATFNGIHKNGAVALVVNGTVTQFLSFDATVTAIAGPANGMSSTQLGGTSTGESRETSDNGATYDVQSSPTPGNVPCFLAGTLILTSRGYRPVEQLGIGDRVITADDGPQPVLWAGQRLLTPQEHLDPDKRPVRIPAGALGPGVPAQDLHVSPNHRIALSHPACELYFHASEVFAAAKVLAGVRNIAAGIVATPVRYHHLLLQKHQVIWANGTATESFHPASLGLESFDVKARSDILEVIGSPATYGPTARIALKAHEVQLLLASVADNAVLAIGPHLPIATRPELQRLGRSS